MAQASIFHLFPPRQPTHSTGRVGRQRRALIVTDKFLFNNGYCDETIKILKGLGLDTEVFYEVEADPTLAVVRAGTKVAESFQPDVIIALGGGSPMDAAKIIWVMYEHPQVDFADLALRFMDIRKRIYKFPKLGRKAKMVAIPTTSGTGSEVTPFAVVTDEKTGAKYPIADYELTPNMAIVDPNLVMDMPKSLTAFGGIDAITHALEAYVSVMANEYSDGQALQALSLLVEHLPKPMKKALQRRLPAKKCTTVRPLPVSPLPTLSWEYVTLWPINWVPNSICPRFGQCSAHKQCHPFQRHRPAYQAGRLQPV